MKKHIKTVAFLVIFLLINTVALAEPVLDKIEKVAERVKQEIKASGDLNIGPGKVTLDILGLRIEKVNGKWVVKASDSKTTMRFENEIHLVSVEDAKGEEIIKELIEIENSKIIELKDQSKIIAVEWDGKDRINSQDLGDVDSESKSLFHRL